MKCHKCETMGAEVTRWTARVQRLEQRLAAIRLIADGHESADGTEKIMREIPPRPSTDETWAAHWAFYVLTVSQRNQAWHEAKVLREQLSVAQPVAMHLHDAASQLQHAEAKVRQLRALLQEYATHAADSGWPNLAAEIRHRTDEALNV